MRRETMWRSVWVILAALSVNLHAFGAERATLANDLAGKVLQGTTIYGRKIKVNFSSGNQNGLLGGDWTIESLGATETQNFEMLKIDGNVFLELKLDDESAQPALLHAIRHSKNELGFQRIYYGTHKETVFREIQTITWSRVKNGANLQMTIASGTRQCLDPEKNAYVACAEPHSSQFILSPLEAAPTP